MTNLQTVTNLLKTLGENKEVKGINETGSLERVIIRKKNLNDLEVRVLEYIQKVTDWCPEDECTMDEGVDLYLECKNYPEMDNYSNELEKFVQAVICAGRNQIPYVDKGICGRVNEYRDADKHMEDCVMGKITCL